MDTTDAAALNQHFRPQPLMKICSVIQTRHPVAARMNPVKGTPVRRALKNGRREATGAANELIRINLRRTG